MSTSDRWSVAWFVCCAIGVCMLPVHLPMACLANAVGIACVFGEMRAKAREDAGK